MIFEGCHYVMPEDPIETSSESGEPVIKQEIEPVVKQEIASADGAPAPLIDLAAPPASPHGLGDAGSDYSSIPTVSVPPSSPPPKRQKPSRELALIPDQSDSSRGPVRVDQRRTERLLVDEEVDDAFWFSPKDDAAVFAPGPRDASDLRAPERCGSPLGKGLGLSPIHNTTRDGGSRDAGDRTPVSPISGASDDIGGIFDRYCDDGSDSGSDSISGSSIGSIRRKTLPEKIHELEAWIETEYIPHPDVTPDWKRVLAAVIWIACEARQMRYTIDDTDKVAVFRLLDGFNWRRHNKILYAYNVEGYWEEMGDGVKFTELAAEYLLAAGGLFTLLAEDEQLQIGDKMALCAMREGVRASVPSVEDLLAQLRQSAKEAGDASKFTTDGRAYRAAWQHRLADVTADLWKSSMKGDLDPAVYMQHFETPHPGSDGWVFEEHAKSAAGDTLHNVYMNSQFERQKPSRERNCYRKLPYKSKPDINDRSIPEWSEADYKRVISTYIRAACYGNPWLMQHKFTMIWMAMIGKPAMAMLFLVGEGNTGIDCG